MMCVDVTSPQRVTPPLLFHPFPQIYVSPNAAVIDSGGFFDYETEVRREIRLRLTAEDQVRASSSKHNYEE